MRLCVRHFYRYCDDGVVLCKTKAELWKIRDVVHHQIEHIGLKVKPNERVFPVGEGIDLVSIRELVNLPIVVKDFEMDIKTEQGEDRCIVAIEMNGEPKKFFTNSEEMKNILAQVREMPDGFPFETTIKTETFGKGRTKYVFS